MGVDMFICGCCQWVFHSIEEFMLHKNTVCGENNQNKKQVIKLEMANDGDNNMRELENYQVVENADVTDEEKTTVSVQVDSSTDKGNELAVDQVIKEEAVGGHQVIQVQANSDDDQSSAQLAPAIQHHIVELQGPDGMQQLQIANVPGQNLELQDIITALQQGQALTVQDGSVLPTEIQVVVAAKADADGTQETTNGSITCLTTALSGGLGEGVTPTKPVRKRGRPRKGEEKNKPIPKAEPVMDDRPKCPQRDADGRLTCRRCKKKFSKERHFNTHKCLALSDFVDIMETELINMGEEESDDEEEVDRSRDRDFRVPPAMKKRKLDNAAPIIIRPRNEVEGYFGNSIESQDGALDKTGEHNKTLVCSEEQENKPLVDGLTTPAEDVSDLTKEGLADFPGAGDVKLSQVRVEDGTDEVKLQDALTTELSVGSQEKENHKLYRGRKQKAAETIFKRPVIKNLPIFKNEEDRIEFEKCTNIDLSEVDHLYRQHVIDQNINEHAPPAKNRGSDKLNVFSCDVCQKIIMTKSHARLHCLTHTDMKPFKCFKCAFATNTKGNLYSHMRKHTGQLYRCSVCSFSTINKGHLIEHSAVHSGERHECKICHKDYSTSKSLYGHVCRKHRCTKKGKEYMASLRHRHSRGQAILHQCHVCNRKFKKKVDRDRHMYMHDIKDNPNVFTCDLCNRTCSRRNYLEKHLLRHRIIFYCCDCDQKFPSTQNLTQHLKETHFSGEIIAEEVLNQIFEKCIESSIYLPEPGGIESMDNEFEEVDDTLLSTDGLENGKSENDLTQQENYTKDQLVDEASEKPGAVNISVDKNDELQLESNVVAEDLLLLKNEDSQVTQQANLKSDDKEALDESLEEANLLSSDKDKSAGSPHSDTTNNYTNRRKTISEENSILSTKNTEKDSVEDTSSSPVRDNDIPDNTPRGDDHPTVSNGTETSMEMAADIKDEFTLSSQELVYDKQYFMNLGFKVLNMNTYNQIRHVFGKEECEFCGRLYFSTADYEHHRRTHTGEKPFSCNQCNYRAVNKENLKRHIEKQHDKVTFSCSKCNYLTANRSQLWLHIKTHKKPDIYTCPACSRSYSQPKTLKIHINITHPDMPEEDVKMATSVLPKARPKIGKKCFRCPHCDRRFFRNASDLQKHVWIHEGIKPFKCPLCPHACRSRNNLASHMIRHSMDKPFMCTECGRAYKSKTALRWHVRSHKDGKFKCPKCPYEATQTSHLKRHMETHDVIKRYMCQHCTYSSNTLVYLKIHYARRHKGYSFSQSNTVTNQVQMVRSMPDADTKVYRCLSCDYLFGNLSDMKRHLKLRHHIQIDSTNILEDLTGCAEAGEAGPQVLTVDMMNVPVTEDSTVQESVVEQVVQLEDQLGVTVDTTPTQDDNTSTQTLQYSVSSGENDDKIQSAVSILQQIINMSQQGTLGNQEITVKSQDGQSFIVQQQEDVTGTKPESNQFVIQYVMPNGQEVTISENDTQQVINGSEVISQNDETVSERVDVEHQNVSKLSIDIQSQDIANLGMEQTVEVLESHDGQAQPLELDFDGHGSVNSPLPPNLVQMSNIAEEMNGSTAMRTSDDGINNVLALEVSTETLTNIN